MIFIVVAYLVVLDVYQRLQHCQAVNGVGFNVHFVLLKLGQIVKQTN